MNDSGRYDNLHGDEPEIAAEARRCAEEYEAEHADDWKYSDDTKKFEFKTDILERWEKTDGKEQIETLDYYAYIKNFDAWLNENYIQCGWDDLTEQERADLNIGNMQTVWVKK